MARVSHMFSVSNCVARSYIYIMSNRLISKLVYKFSKVL